MLEAMAQGSFVAYYRVSTAKQGASGLGLEAQQGAVRNYLNGGSWKLVAEVTEVESGKRSDRPKLDEAMRLCRLHGATLVIAKLDRLSRDAHFLLGLQKAGVEFIAVDNPHANRLTIHILAAVAEDEAKRISDRTKAALAAAKARGVKLGGDRGARLTDDARRAGRQAITAKARARAADLAPMIAELQDQGVTSRGAIANALNDKGIPTARGGEWSATQVGRVLAKL
jgi:DNA invertase Pin-like site-specific DNA recombinase